MKNVNNVADRLDQKLNISISQNERDRIDKFRDEKCINLSLYTRKLLLDQVSKAGF